MTGVSIDNALSPVTRVDKLRQPVYDMSVNPRPGYLRIPGMEGPQDLPHCMPDRPHVEHAWKPT